MTSPRRPWGIRRLLRLAVRPRAVEQDVDEELRFHLELRAESLMREGYPPSEARAEAERQFGDVARVRAECVRLGREREGQMKRSRLLDAVVQDVRYGLRTLSRSPAFALVAVLTLALGIGATTALFSVVRGVLLQPLPFASPERLVRVWQANTGPDGFPRGVVSPLDLADWRARQRSYSDMGAWFHAGEMSGVDLVGRGEPQRLATTYVDSGFFSTLGVAPLLGRVPEAGEHVAGRDAVAVVSHGFWQRQLGGDAAVLGRTLTLDGVPHTVVGVMPPSFTFPAQRVDVWLPVSHIKEDDIPSSLRQVRWLQVVARLRDGVGVEQARSDMEGIARQLADEHPATNAQFRGATLLSLHEAVTGDVRAGLLVLLGAVAFLLLIACSNVANLLLARATLRERELAVRAALGAGPGRLVGQLLAESLLLAALGGALGVLLAVWGTQLLAGLSLKQLPRLHEVRVDGGVLAFALGVTLLTGLLFGLLPALRAVTPQLAPVLKSGRSVAGPRGARLRSALVVAEVALAVVLAAGAGLATRSLARLLTTDAGFRPEGATVVSFSVPPGRQDDIPGYLARVLEQVRAAPGVEVAATAKWLPLEGEGETVPVAIAGRPVGNVGDLPRGNLLHVSNDYFRALGIPLLRGRAFTAADDGKAPTVLVVNQAFARRFFPGEEAVGKALQWGRSPATIVGVVGDVRQASLSEPAAPLLYIHVLQNPRSGANLVLRGKGTSLALAAAARRAIWSVNPEQTLSRITTLEEVVGEAVSRPRLLAVLLGLFAALGLTLGAVGIYGVLAYTVSQRQRELGVRLALGARPGDVLRLVVRSGMALAGTGVALGVVGALGLSRLMQSVLYGVVPHDPVTFCGVVVLLGGVALVACLVPARRAMRVDPAVTLRAE